jgi:hypothetical protein
VKHGPNNIKNYLEIHESVLSEYTEKHSDEPRIYIAKYSEGYILVQLLCTEIKFKTYSGLWLRCDISKTARKDTLTGRVKTIRYSYTVSSKQGCIFHYDSPDPDKTEFDSENHHTYHHKHDYRTGDEVITKIPDDAWPHVNEFFDEVLELTSKDLTNIR